MEPTQSVTQVGDELSANSYVFRSKQIILQYHMYNNSLGTGYEGFHYILCVRQFVVIPYVCTEVHTVMHIKHQVATNEQQKSFNELINLTLKPNTDCHLFVVDVFASVMSYSAPVY